MIEILTNNGDSILVNKENISCIVKAATDYNIVSMYGNNKFIISDEELQKLI